MENNQVFIKKYISKHRAKRKRSKDFPVIFSVQETKNSNLFYKNCTQENGKCHMKKADLDES